MCKSVATSIKIAKSRFGLARLLCCLSWAVPPLLASCINEDLSDCGSDYKIRYEVRLLTDIEAQIDAETETLPERGVAESLKAVLSRVFDDCAHDVDLSFYQDNHGLSHHESHVIEDKVASYTLYLPVRNYRHLATANDKIDSRVKLQGESSDRTLCLSQAETDTVDSHEYGIFSARQHLKVEQHDQEFYVPLYMQNSAAVLMVERGNVKISSMTGYLQGMADGFHVADSTYSFQRQALVRTLKVDNPHCECLYGVSFPSRDGIDLQRREAGAGNQGIWNFKVYVALPNGKITETVLHVYEPLQAGKVKIVKGVLKEDGSIEPQNPEVGATVELDWKEGGIYEPEI